MFIVIKWKTFSFKFLTLGLCRWSFFTVKMVTALFAKIMEIFNIYVAYSEKLKL
jgi:hypothetical protein